MSDETHLTSLERLPGMKKGGFVIFDGAQYLVKHILQKDVMNADGSLSITFIVVGEPLFPAVDREQN